LSFDITGDDTTITAADDMRLVSGSGDDIYMFDAAAQMFKFELIATKSYLYGGADAGDDLLIIANSADSSPSIELAGGGDITITSDADVYIKEQSTQMFKFSLSVDDSKIYGGTGETADCYIFANSHADGYPRIQLMGNADIQLRTNSNAGDVYFYEEETQMFKFSYAGNRSTIAGGNVNGDDLTIVCNTADTNGEIFLDTGTDVVKFGTHTALDGESVSGYINIKDSAGNARKLAVVS